ncbi:MAG: hypothetical protein R6W80_07970, partial [Haliea sp.]
YGPDRSRNYAIAWSLTHFLLEGAPGMYALQRVIQQAEARFCQAFSAVAELDAAYPGGLRRLERDWRQWLGRSASRASLHKLDYAPKVEAPGDNRQWLPQTAPTRNSRSLLCA